MVIAGVTWDHKQKVWTCDCPECGRLNWFDIGKERLPKEVLDMCDRAIGMVQCWKCEEQFQGCFCLKSKRRSKK